MKVLLCGEGHHDNGVQHYWDKKNGEYVTLEGWMQPIVRSALTVNLEFSVRQRRELQLSSRDPNKSKLPKGHATKAYLAKLAAITGGYDFLVFMVDADSKEVKRWRAIEREIQEGFELATGEVRCIACVPMAASESWLLSDPSAWAKIAGYNFDGLPAKPESIWGARDDPTGNHPHRVFFRTCAAADVADDRETRFRIATEISLTVARERCPSSMEPFLAAIQA